MSDSLSFEFEFDKNDLSALTKAIHVPWWMRLLKWVGVALGLVLTVIVGFALLVLRVSLTEFEIVVVLVGLLFALGLLLIFEPTMRIIRSPSVLDHQLGTPVDQGRGCGGVIRLVESFESG